MQKSLDISILLLKNPGEIKSENGLSLPMHSSISITSKSFAFPVNLIIAWIKLLYVKIIVWYNFDSLEYNKDILFARFSKVLFLSK